MGASAGGTLAFDRCLSRGHEDIENLRAQLSAAGGANQHDLERAIVRVGERLAWCIDIDPLLKHDFLLLYDAARLYRRRFGDRGDAAIAALCDQCFATYRTARQTALDSAVAFEELPSAEAITAYEDLARLCRFDRLRAQATLIKRNASDMSRAYAFLLDALPSTAERILNIGDGVPLGHSFLRRIVTKMQDAGRRPHVVTIDVGPGLYALQRESAIELAQSGCTLAFHRMDASATWFADAVFDCAVGSFMFDDCRDQPGLLSELGRVVAPDGVVGLSGHHLSSEHNADRFVHNYADFHAVSGYPVTLADVVRMVQPGPLEIRDRYENPHAWVVVLKSEHTVGEPFARSSHVRD